MNDFLWKNKLSMNLTLFSVTEAAWPLLQRVIEGISAIPLERENFWGKFYCYYFLPAGIATT